MKYAIAATLALALTGCTTAGTPSLPSAGPTEPYAITARDRANVERAFSYVLKDPESVRLPALEGRLGQNGYVYVCGFVNAKNSFGGYVGPRIFYGYGQGNNIQILVIGDDDASTARAFELCRHVGFNI